MKREYVKLFSFMIGISLVIASLIFVFSQDVKAEKQKEIDNENAIMDEIGDIYTAFTKKAEEFADTHEAFIKNIDDKTEYFDIVPDNYQDLLKSAINYENTLVEIDDMDSYLYERCTGNHFYSRPEVNTNCLTYIRNMEKLTNTFIEDIKYFNHRIELFNEWTEENNASVIATKKYDKLEDYKSEKYNEYVDLDKDGTYLGVVSD